jgi:hypothetical protein
VAAVAAVGVTVLLAAASVPLYFLTNQNWLVDGGENVAVAVLFAVAGFVIVRRQPRNPVGWILLVAPAGSQLLPADAGSYAQLAYRPGHRLPMGAVALLLEYSWAPVARSRKTVPAREIMEPISRYHTHSAALELTAPMRHRGGHRAKMCLFSALCRLLPREANLARKPGSGGDCLGPLLRDLDRSYLFCLGKRDQGNPIHENSGPI